MTTTIIPRGKGVVAINDAWPIGYLYGKRKGDSFLTLYSNSKS